MGQTNKIYFPNLNGLRFIAAFLVIIHHLEQMLWVLGKSHYWDNLIIKTIGGLGVTLFFVLSGFLITYLLLAEEKTTKKISIKQFYIRRILRIWPLYFTIILASFFIFPHIKILEFPALMAKVNTHFWMYFVMFVLFLPNLVLFGFWVVLPYGSQSWSVGVEEQFYFIWPILMKFVKNKLVLLISVILIYFAIKYPIFLFIKNFIGWNNKTHLVASFFNSFQIYSMAIGGIFAYMAFHKNAFFEKYVLRKFVFWIALITTITCILLSLKILTVVYSFLFGIIIYNLACNKGLKNALEVKSLNYLGKISYGLYMYHPLAIMLIINTFDFLKLPYSRIFLLTAVTLLTVLIAGLSYRFMEKRFIILKSKYSKIISGENVKIKQ